MAPGKQEVHQQADHEAATDSRAEDMPPGKAGRDRIDILNAGAERNRLGQAENLPEGDRATTPTHADQRGEDCQDNLFVFDQTAKPSQEGLERLSAHGCAAGVAGEGLMLGLSRWAK